MGRIDGCFLSIWIHEAVPSCWPESAALSCESLLKYDSSPLWSVSSQLTSTIESLSWSTVLHKASASSLSLGSVAALIDWKGDWWAQPPVVWGCSWLPTTWMEYCVHCHGPPCHFDLWECCWGRSLIPYAWDWGPVWKNRCPTRVQVAGISKAGGTGGGVLTWDAGLLIYPGAVVLLSYKVVTAVSASLTELWDQHWTWQQWREIMEEASPNWSDSSERGPPWRSCASAQSYWSINPLVSKPSWIVCPHNSWSTLQFWGPASVQADPWPG